MTQIDLRLKLFHEAKTPLANGHKRDTLLMLSDNEFESNHGFIQWAFPTNVQSQSVSSAPVLNLESAIWLAKNAGFTRFLEDMAVRFLDFLKRKNTGSNLMITITLE